LFSPFCAGTGLAAVPPALWARTDSSQNPQAGAAASWRMSTLGWILVVVLVLIVFGFISIRIF
jgi:hypothetical protein